MPVIDKLLSTIRKNKPAAYGFLDSYENGFAKGWAYDPNEPMARMSIQLTVDGEPIDPVDADLHRPDLEAAGHGDGRHAFEILLPQRFRDSKQHTIDGKIAGLNEPLKHGPLTVVLEAVPEPPVSAGTSAILRESALNALSVVIATSDRAQALEQNLRASMDAAKWLNVEFVVVDNGSRDDTAARLGSLAKEFPNLRWRTLAKGSESRARNTGVAMATNELILFQGDETQPETIDFYKHHLNAHRMLPNSRVAVLGGIVWPNSEEARVSFMMSHTQAAGPPFGYYNLTPYTWVDWRFFHSSNFSFKKSVLTCAAADDDEWTGYEFAYRVNQSIDGGWQILYTPNAAVKRARGLSVREVLEQRLSAGSAARKFLRSHPGAAGMLGTHKIDALLTSPAKASSGPLEDMIRMIEGVKSWAVVIESHYNLGSQNWHADLLSAVFEVSYLQGYVMSCEEPGANFGAAYRYVLERFQEKMATAATFEVFGRFPSFPLT